MTTTNVRDFEEFRSKEKERNRTKTGRRQRMM